MVVFCGWEKQVGHLRTCFFKRGNAWAVEIGLKIIQLKQTQERINKRLQVARKLKELVPISWGQVCPPILRPRTWGTISSQWILFWGTTPTCRCCPLKAFRVTMSPILSCLKEGQNVNRFWRKSWLVVKNHPIWKIWSSNWIMKP